MRTWQILSLIGTIVVLFAGVLPLISVQFIGTFSISLFDIYGLLGRAPQIPQQTSEWTEAFSSVGAMLLLTIVLFPIVVIAGFVSIVFGPKVALIAGILGILCWFSSLLAVLQLKSLISQMGGPFGGLAASLVQIGYGVYVGIFGAVILLISYFVAAKEVKALRAPPAPPPTEGS